MNPRPFSGSRGKIGARLLRAREALGLSQAQTAKKLEVSRETVTRWETGHEPGALARRVIEAWIKESLEKKGGRDVS